MPEALIHKFIFAAGFSTAAAVTSVSGRGVGMDVVRNNIDQIGGTVDVKSVPGVAEVAPLGGFVRQYQVQVDPNRLRTFNIPIGKVLEIRKDCPRLRHVLVTTSGSAPLDGPAPPGFVPSHD